MGAMEIETISTDLPKRSVLKPVILIGKNTPVQVNENVCPKTRALSPMQIAIVNTDLLDKQVLTITFSKVC